MSGPGTPAADAVVVVIIDGDRLLFIQRGAGTPGGGHWAPLSGKVEHGESQESAVVREAFEEVGLTVRPLRKVWEHPSDISGYLLHWWLADYVGGDLVLEPREVAAARWVTYAEIASLTPTFTHDREFFQQVFPMARR